MTLSASELDQLKHAPAVEGVLPVIHKRWSPRSFADRDVTPEDLAKIFEAVRWAPSSSNEQPWGFLVGMRGAKPKDSDTHSKIASVLVGFNQSWALKAPVLILGVARSKSAGKETPNAYAFFDLGAATLLLVLQATELGLSAHQMAGYDHDAARKALEIPDDFQLGSVIALGYQGEPAALASEQLIAREVAPRQRKALKDFVFSKWGEPADLGGVSS
jgi:nitroreductase